MSISPIINIHKIWLRAESLDSKSLVYIGEPVEIHPDKIIFKSKYKVQSPVYAKIGKLDFIFENPVQKVHTKSNEDEYYYLIDFTSYYQCLSFMFSWSKSLTAEQLNNSMSNRKFTHFFNIDDLSSLLSQISVLDITNENWSTFVKYFIDSWEIDGLELIDSDYDNKVFSKKKKIVKLPDFSLSIDKHDRFKLRLWGNISEEIKQQVYILSFFLEYLLNSNSFLTVDKREKENPLLCLKSTRTYKLIGKSDFIQKLRKAIQFHKVNKGNLWIKGDCGTGKSLFAKIISEEFNNTAKFENHFTFSLFNQSRLIGSLEELCQKDDKAKVIILDNFDLLEESNEILIQKIVKNNIYNKYIFISNKSIPAYFDGDILNFQPLKERYEDLNSLAAFLIEDICRQKDIPSKKISEVFFKKMKVYKWPGNITELKYFLRGLVEYHYFDSYIEYRNEDFRHQCDPQQKQLFRFEKLKKESDFTGAYWKEKILKTS